MEAPVRCSSCPLRESCLPSGLPAAEVERIEQIVSTRFRVRPSDALVRVGDPFTSVYAVRSGFLKSREVAGDGREQVIAFHSAGDIVGLEGISREVHGCDTVALQESEVCAIAYDRLASLAGTLPGLRNRFHKILSREIVRKHSEMLALGSMDAKERLAHFLVALSGRLGAHGAADPDFFLPMVRADIASYLGLTLETVSRTLSRLADQSLIEIDHKHVRIVDPRGLVRQVTGTEAVA